jgi:hypothetical protein
MTIFFRSASSSGFRYSVLKIITIRSPCKQVCVPHVTKGAEADAANPAKELSSRRKPSQAMLAKLQMVLTQEP